MLRFLSEAALPGMTGVISRGPGDGAGATISVTFSRMWDMSVPGSGVAAPSAKTGGRRSPVLQTFQEPRPSELRHLRADPCLTLAHIRGRLVDSEHGRVREHGG